jgi:hypothetical protein
VFTYGHRRRLQWFKDTTEFGDGSKQRPRLQHLGARSGTIYGDSSPPTPFDAHYFFESGEIIFE